MKKKFINSLKVSSLLGFASNNIKADYTLRLKFDIDIKVKDTDCVFQLKGDNNEILYDQTKSKNNFLDVLRDNKCTHDVNNFEDIKRNYVPVYYYVKGDENPKIYKFVNGKGGEVPNFDGNEKNVEEVVWVAKSDKKNIVTFCSVNTIKNDIISRKFLVDKDYIYNFILKNESKFFKSIDNIKKMFDININLDKNGNQNIEIIFNPIFKISDTEKFKISEKDVKDDDYITPLNNLENLYINTDKIEKLFNEYEIKNTAITYIFEYNNKKYYIVSDKKHNQYELFKFLKTKKTLKDKDIIFDPNSKIKIEAGIGNLVPGEYKLIDKVSPKPKDDKIEYKYKFTGDSTAFKFNPEVEENYASKIKVFEMVNSNEKSNFMEDGTTYNTVKYDFVAINKDTNQKFVNNQELEPGTYELKREEKPQDKEEKNKEQMKGQGDVQNKEKPKRRCNCC